MAEQRDTEANPPLRSAKSQPDGPAPDVHALDDTYEVLGELRAAERGRKYLAKRRDDGADVVITIVTPPAGSDNNELSHFAADVQLLATLHHPRVAQVFEARWLGRAALAVVSERLPGTTLHEALERNERFTNPRIAAVLQEVMGALDWARGHKIVHRGVSPENLYFEPGTERVLLALTPTPIPITGVPDACSDASTVGKLAWAMLAGTPRAAGEGKQSLADLSPNLAVRVIEATEKMIGCKTGETVPDIPAFLGIIAAGDALKQAEVELAALKDEYEEHHLAALAKFENDREEIERHAAEHAAHVADECHALEQHAAEQAAQLGDERAAFERQTAEQAAAFNDERADFERVMTERQEQLAAVRTELESQAAAVELRLAELDERRHEFERLRAEARSSALVASERADGAELAAHEPATYENEAYESDAPKDSEAIRGLVATLGGGQPAAKSSNGKRAPRRWMVPAAAGAIGLAFFAAIGAIHHQNSVAAAANAAANTAAAGKATVVPVAPNLDRPGLTRGGFLTQSAGGSIAPAAFGPPLARAGDSARLAGQSSATTDSVAAPRPAPKPVERPRPKPRPAQPANDVNGMAPSSIFDLPKDTTRRDTTGGRRDTVVKRDTVVRRDTVMKRDSLARRDSTGRVRPDTLTNLSAQK